MSSSESDPKPESAFGENLRDARAELRRGDLRHRLDEQAEMLREFVLLTELYEALTDESVVLDDDVQRQIDDMRSYIEDRDFGSIESSLDDLEDALDEEIEDVQEDISEHRISVNKTIEAMDKLNERVENVNPDQISDLREQYAELTDLEFVEGETLSEERSSVRDKVDELQSKFDAVQEDVFGQFYGTDLEGIVRDLLDDEAFRIDELSTNQFERLKNSPLSDCLELLLS